MRSLTIVLFAVVASAALALPSSVEEFRARQATEATTAQGAAKLWFDAALVYETNPVLGTRLLSIAMKDKEWMATVPHLLDTLRLKPYVLRSYLKGATPEDGYRVNPDSYELDIRDISLQPLPQYSLGKVVRLSLQSTGADGPRFLDLEQSGDGRYLVRDPRPLCAPLRPPSVHP